MKLCTLRLNTKLNSLNLKDISFFLLFFSSSGFFLHSTWAAYLIPLSISFAFLLSFKPKCKGNLIILYLLFIFFLSVSSIFNQDSISSFITAILAITSGFLIAVSVSKKDFVTSFTRIMYFLSCYSIVVFFLSIIFSKFPLLFPKIIDGRSSAHWMIFAFIRPATKWVTVRNQSIFWEPGVFQTYLILAFLLEVSLYGLVRKKYIIAYILALVTTMSTTGYIALLLAIIVWLVEINQKGKLKHIKIIISFIVIISTCLLIFSILPQGHANRTFDKIKDLLNGDSSNISVIARIESVLNTFRAVALNPIIGIGSHGLSTLSASSYGMLTFTPGNWMGRYGLFFGILANLGFVQLFDTMYKSSHVKWLVAVIFLLIISTEAYTSNAVIWTFIFYGFTFYKDKIELTKH